MGDHGRIVTNDTNVEGRVWVVLGDRFRLGELGDGIGPGGLGKFM